MVDSFSHGTPVTCLTPMQLAVKCAECGESVWPGGPVYCWQDGAVRCHSCKQEIEAGRIETKVPDSRISDWYSSERAIWRAEAKRARAVVAGDEDTVKAMDEVMGRCLDIRRDIIRARIEGESHAA